MKIVSDGSTERRPARISEPSPTPSCLTSQDRPVLDEHRPLRIAAHPAGALHVRRQQPRPADARGARCPQHVAREVERVDALALAAVNDASNHSSPFSPTCTLPLLSSSTITADPPVAESLHRLDERVPQSGPFSTSSVVAKPSEPGSSSPRPRSRRPHRAVPHRVGRDRIHDVRVLRLVEQPIDENAGWKPRYVDQLAARAVRPGRTAGEAAAVQGVGGDDDRTRIDTTVTPSRSTYSTPTASRPRSEYGSTRLGAELETAGRSGVVDVRVQRRLARVGRAALEARAERMQFASV